ncbi:MAG: type II toxin-antitoxin system VapC family toxin [bacterium]|nr:type II toxin-antitoxin system VapC family toxin [bacterium]
MDAVFLDASYAIALASPKDSNHERALELAQELEGKGSQLTTTQAILLEIGNAMSRLRYRKAAILLLASICQDPKIEIVPDSEELFTRAFELYKSRPDKEWGLTDCLSFVVMTERKLNAALTTDRHFVQAGFRALLLEKQEVH